jgi:hypothetical protein
MGLKISFKTKMGLKDCLIVHVQTPHNMPTLLYENNIAEVGQNLCCWRLERTCIKHCSEDSLAETYIQQSTFSTMRSCGKNEL